MVRRESGNPVLRRPQGVTSSAGTSTASSDTVTWWSSGRGPGGKQRTGDEDKSTLYFDRRGVRANGLST